jgi:hypothetical protein
MVEVAAASTSAVAIKPRPTLGKDVYPGVSNSEDLSQVKLDDRPINAAELEVAKAILKAMTAAADAAPKLLDKAGNDARLKAVKDKKIDKETSKKLWTALFPLFYKLIEAKKMQLACDQKNPRPTLAREIYPGMSADDALAQVKLDDRPINAAELEVAKTILNAMIAAADAAPKLLDKAGNDVRLKAVKDKKIDKETSKKLWAILFPLLYKLIENRLMISACPVGPDQSARQVEIKRQPVSPVVTISGVAPYWAMPGSEAQFVVTGEHFKRVTKVEAPEMFKDLGMPEIKDDGTSMTFSPVLVPADAQPGEQEFVLYGGKKGDEKLASFKVAVPAMSAEGFSDNVKKMHIKLDVNSGLAAGASGYPALGIYEEPITVNTFGVAAGLAPQIIGEKGLKQSDKHELSASAEADLAYRGYKDNSTMSGAKLGLDYQLRLKPQFSPEVYGNLSYRKSHLKNPTPQYFNGSTLAENAGVAVNSLWAKGISSRAYFGWNFGQSSIDKDPLGFSYHDHAQYLETGLKLRLGFFERQSKAPNVELAAGLQYGSHEDPERARIAGVWTDYGNSKETVKIITAGGKIDWDKNFRLGYNYTARRYGGFWDAVDIHHLGAGTSAKGGDWDVNVDLRPKSNFTSVGLSWQDPWLHAVGLSAGYLKLDGHNGGFVGVGLKLYPVAEKIWGKSRPIYPAAVEAQTEPAAAGRYDELDQPPLAEPTPAAVATPAPAPEPAKPEPAKPVAPPPPAPAAPADNIEGVLNGLDEPPKDK